MRIGGDRRALTPLWLHACSEKQCRVCLFAAEISENVIVGVRSWYSVPVIGRYAECGRYPSELTAGAMVKLQCDRPLYGQHVIVQFPAACEMNFREIDVCGQGERLCYITFTVFSTT